MNYLFFLMLCVSGPQGSSCTILPAPMSHETCKREAENFDRVETVGGTFAYCINTESE